MAYLNGCCCGVPGLGGLGVTVGETPIPNRQRLLTTGEITDFLMRHPVTAAQVLATKAALATIGIDQIDRPPEWYEVDVNIGLIPRAGVEVLDSKYGRVIIFPGANGVIYFNGFVGGSGPGPAPGEINKPPYQSLPGPPGDNDWLSTLNTTARTGLLIVVGLIALQLFGKRR